MMNMKFWLSILFFFKNSIWQNIFEKSKVPPRPDDSVPDSHERDSKKESKSSSDLGNHCGRGIKKFFFFHWGVPGWNDQNAEQWISLPCLSKERKDKMIARRVEGGRDASSVDPVLEVTARLSTASNPLDHFKFFVFHLIVELLKFPGGVLRVKIMFSPVFVNLCTDSDLLIAPNIPAWSTTNPPSETFLDADTKVVSVVFHTRVFRNVHF